jgi:hypothetical protein
MKGDAADERDRGPGHSAFGGGGTALLVSSAAIA